MLYVSLQDFFQKTANLPRLSRDAELALAAAMVSGDLTARAQLVEGYLPMVAGHIRHCKDQLQRLTLVYACLQALERAVDSFDFFQNSEPFSRHLSRYLRQATVRCIAQQREANI